MDENLLFNLAFENDAQGLTNAISAGYDPNIIHPRAGHTPLQVACETNSLEAISILLGMGADPNLQFTKISRTGGLSFRNRVALMYVSSTAATDILANAGADLDICDDQGWSSLALAVKSCEDVLVRKLVQLGASTELQDPLHMKYPALLNICEDKMQFLGRISKDEPNAVIDSRLVALESIRNILINLPAAK